ncbi:hypothetical protein [Alicyclobacillus sacchari]
MMSKRDIAWIRFGDKLGIYDFTAVSTAPGFGQPTCPSVGCAVKLTITA